MDIAKQLRELDEKGYQPMTGAIGKEAADKIEQLSASGQRLALELECLLMDTKDLPTVSKWWDSAHEALEQWSELRNIETPNALAQASGAGQVEETTGACTASPAAMG